MVVPIKPGDIPPWEEGTLDKAASYIWGVYAWAVAEGIGQEHIEPYLEVIPRPEGEQKRWLQELLWGGELTDPKLATFLAEGDNPKDLPAGKEYFVLTSIYYRISNPALFIAELAKAPDYEIEEKISGEEWTIERLEGYPEEDEPQLEGVEDMRRVLAHCQLADGLLKVEANTLSRAVRVVQEIKHYTGEQMAYEGVAWTSFRELLKKSKKQDKKGKHPVKKKQDEKLF